ncbi:hypothetical protein [Brevibacillus sp. 179-C9.3 HS]|uniref:hypothetical protein n=1 Tax=unclassified Brevibacillus TaxID=2684853 RepID=UPI0039A16358
MKKVTILLFLMLSVFLSNGGIVSAADPPGVLIKEEMTANLKNMEEEANLTDSIWIRFSRYIFESVPIASMDTLVFGNPYYVWMDKADGVNVNSMKYGLFPEEVYTKVIDPGVNIFAGAYFGFVTLAILLATLKLGWRAYTPQGKADFWVDIQMWVFSGLFMLSTTILYDVIFEMNNSIVSEFGGLIPNKSAVSIIANSSGWKIGDIFVFLAEWGLSLYLNFIYISRLIVIIFLMILAIVAAISLLYAKTRPFFGIWIKELCGNVFLQSIHALVLAAMAGLASLGAGTMFKLGMIILFVPVTGIISRWLQLGDSSSRLGQALTMTGLSSIGGAVMLAKQAGQVMGGARNNARQGGGESQNMGSDRGTTGIAEAAKGSSSPGWQRIKNTAGNVGMIAGATAGLPFGGMGAAVGGYLGSKIGRGMVQMPRNLSSSAAQTLRTLRTKGEGTKDGKFFGEWDSLSARRDWYGRLGESIGSAAGETGSHIGRSMGHMMSGVSRQRVQSQDFSNKTLSDYAADPEFSGANVRWQQDNRGSAFYAQSNKDGNWKRISAIGAADATLKRGENRVVDYKLNNGANWTRQENGTYQLSGGSSAPRAYTTAPSPLSVSNTSAPPSLNGVPITNASASPSLNGVPITNASASPSPNGVPITNTSAPSSPLGIPRTYTSAPPVAIGGSNNMGGGTSAAPYSPGGNTGGGTLINPPASSGGVQVAGLSGSTSYLGRQSGAYIVGTDNKRYEDRRMDPGNINPDQYFAHNIQGVSRRTTTDFGADLTHRSIGAAKTAKAWAATGVKNTYQRAKGLIG